jgi:hypothetical protein
LHEIKTRSLHKFPWAHPAAFTWAVLTSIHLACLDAALATPVGYPLHGNQRQCHFRMPCSFWRTGLPTT